MSEEILKNAKSMTKYSNCAHMSRKDCPIGHDKPSCHEAECNGTSGTFAGEDERTLRRKLAQEYINHQQEQVDE